jgi:hypothetical protein
MTTLTRTLRRAHKHQRRRLLLALALGAATLAAAHADAPPDGAAISLIAMEKDCFGCPSGSRLLLRRDGFASLTQTAKARHGTQEQSSVGVVGAAEFEALARLTLAQGWFELQTSYDDPQQRDGAWTVILVERSDGTAKQVFRRAGTGPAALDVIESALRELQGGITFTRKHP